MVSPASTRLTLVTLAMIIGFSGWLTFAENGSGVPLATTFGCILLVTLFVANSLTAAFLAKSTLSMLVRAVVVWLAAFVSAVIITICDGGGFRYVDDLVVNGILLLADLLLLHFVIAALRPWIFDSETPARYSIRHLLFVTFGVASFLAFCRLGEEVTTILFLGLVFGVAAASIIRIHTWPRSWAVGAIVLVASVVASGVFAQANPSLAWGPIALPCMVASSGLLLRFSLRHLPNQNTNNHGMQRSGGGGVFATSMSTPAAR